MNRAWHERHPMPKKPTTAQRSAWHQAHAKACGCRPMPATLRSAALRKAATIDEYLAGLSGETRRALERLRRAIRRIIPDAEECISYAMPAFRVGGRVVAGFAARANGGSYYPFSGTTLQTLAGELAGYDRTKSALHFTAARPLPVALVRRLLAARIAEIRR